VALASLHHVTCVCSDAQRTAAFYRDELGFSLVKKTVNFDDPHSYHLYFGDEDASPGSLLTFFEWPRAERGRLGRGTFESIGLVSPNVQAEWQLEDPDGLRLRVLPGEKPGLHDVVAIGNPLLYAGLLDEGAPIAFAPPTEEVALIGAGTTHHIAWRAADDAEQAVWLDRLTELGLRPTPVQDRKYFRSIYFRLPDGILLEIATDGPGFLVDEPAATLGTSLSLPPWLEAERETLERELAPISEEAR
jgi:glyoxalase family protein